MTSTEQVLAGNDLSYLQIYLSEVLEGLNEVEVRLELLVEGAGESVTIASAKGDSIYAALENLDRELAPRLFTSAVRAFWEGEEETEELEECGGKGVEGGDMAKSLVGKVKGARKFVKGQDLPKGGGVGKSVNPVSAGKKGKARGKK